MREVDVLRTRLDTAHDVADTLAVSWAAFQLVQAIADDHADQAPGMFAAFMLTAAAAADGMDAIGFAPSMPGGPGEPAALQPTADGLSAGEIAGELASLMAVVGLRVQTAASSARHPSDRAACRVAARKATDICRVLTPGQS